MQLPLIPKAPARSDLDCRDGEIDFHVRLVKSLTQPSSAPDRISAADWSAIARDIRFSFTPVPLSPWTATSAEYPEATVRIPLKEGEKTKAEYLLSGESSRVDAETAERLSSLLGSRIGALYSRMNRDASDAGLFISPVRVFAQILFPDGTEGFPSAQAVMLPFASPPHPEFTAISVTDDTLTAALRFPVRFHRLEAVAPTSLQSSCRLSVYVSAPMQLPDSKDCEGSVGTVRTSGGGTARGFRFYSLTSAAMKAAVCGPEHYHQFVNGKIVSGVASPPDYLHHTPIVGGSIYRHGSATIVIGPEFGNFPLFPADAFRPVGSDLYPPEWISDWGVCGDGYLPASLPEIWRRWGRFPSMLMSSALGNADIFPGARRNEIGEGSLIAVAEALRPVSSGQLGEFPLYAFSDEGVWALKVTDDRGFVPAQKLGRHKLAAPDRVWPYLTGVAFRTEDGLYGIEGNRIKPIEECDDSAGNDCEEVTDLSGALPDGIDKAAVEALLSESGHVYCLMTRPMSLSADRSTCHRAVSKGICRLTVRGLPAGGASVNAVLFGTHNGHDYSILRIFNPRHTTLVRTLRHFRYRLMLTSSSPVPLPLLLQIN